jgi:hypothetical protein
MKCIKNLMYTGLLLMGVANGSLFCMDIFIASNLSLAITEGHQGVAQILRIYIQALIAKRRMQECMGAMAQGLHVRLGQSSPVAYAGPDILRTIGQYVVESEVVRTGYSRVRNCVIL